jgi:hypothetical protein
MGVAQVIECLSSNLSTAKQKQNKNKTKKERRKKHVSHKMVGVGP